MTEPEEKLKFDKKIKASIADFSYIKEMRYKELACKINMKPQVFYSKMSLLGTTRRGRSFSVYELYRIAGALGITLDRLIRGYGRS